MKRPWGRFNLLFLTAAVFIGVSMATRLLLALRPEVAVVSVPRVFGYGLLFDFVAACYALAPLALWLALVPDRVARSRVHRALGLAGFVVVVFVSVVLAAAEWLFWDEYGGRFNFIAVDYLLYTHEVLQNIWQSFPV